MKQEDRQYIESLTDREIVDAILQRDTRVTRLYLYEMYYPLFKARYDKKEILRLSKKDKLSSKDATEIDSIKKLIEL